MKKLDSLQIMYSGQMRELAIYHGDLTAIPPDEAVDILVVSAYPGNFYPTQQSLIGALHRNGVSVEQLAKSPAIDLRPDYACWLSKPIHSTTPGLRFERILCFEPPKTAVATEIVGDIFRCINPFAAMSDTPMRVAMPLIATGHLGVPIVEMVMALFDAATHWLERGIPIQQLKIVASSERSASELKGAFGVLKKQFLTHPKADDGAIVGTSASERKHKYDIFMSYSHVNKDAVDAMVAELRRLRPTIRIFVDREELNAGMWWQSRILHALDDSQKIIPVYSPEYLSSPMCQYEFQTALLRHVYGNGSVLLPIYLHTATLPLHFQPIQYIDCLEADDAKMRAACAKIVAQL